MDDIRVSISGVERALRRAGASSASTEAKKMLRGLIEGHAGELCKLAVHLANQRGSKRVGAEDVRMANVQLFKEGVTDR